MKSPFSGEQFTLRCLSNPPKAYFCSVKKILLLLICCSFLIQASIKTAVFIDWKINQARITELYCINKDNPLMHCNGQCYLSKQLKKIESDYQESKTPFNPKNLKATEFLLFLELPATSDLSTGALLPASFQGGFYSFQSGTDFSGSVFHPPVSFPFPHQSA